jgi:hypothetical protein
MSCLHHIMLHATFGKECTAMALLSTDIQPADHACHQHSQQTTCGSRDDAALLSMYKLCASLAVDIGYRIHAVRCHWRSSSEEPAAPDHLHVTAAEQCNSRDTLNAAAAWVPSLATPNNLQSGDTDRVPCRTPCKSCLKQRTWVHARS